MYYHNISKDDFLNGDGIRAVLFVSGCTHHCKECHNPVTWNRDGGIPFDKAAKEELFNYLKQPYVTGVTFSGGDPLAMYNREEVLSLIKEVREAFPDKTVWVYTGWTKEELIDQGFWDKLAPNIDVIVEGRFEIDKKQTSYRWAGSTNQRVLRKETNFLVNTSSPAYLATEQLEKDLKDFNVALPREVYYAAEGINSKGEQDLNGLEVVKALKNEAADLVDVSKQEKLCQLIDVYISSVSSIIAAKDKKSSEKEAEERNDER